MANGGIKKAMRHAQKRFDDELWEKNKSAMKMVEEKNQNSPRPSAFYA
jgi:hypothetical protein